MKNDKRILHGMLEEEDDVLINRQQEPYEDDDPGSIGDTDLGETST